MRRATPARARFHFAPRSLQVAVACATANIVGGFLITDRMLSMFKRTKTAPAAKTENGAPSAVKS